jgi:hypothetical protein
MQKATQETISKNFRQTFSAHHVRLFDTSLTIRSEWHRQKAKKRDERTCRLIIKSQKELKMMTVA